LASAVGVAYDTATFITAQQTDDADVRRTVTVCINPDQIIRGLMSGGAAENTALTLHDVTTATTDGLDVTTGDNHSSPTMDEGVIWAYDGVNVGQFRKITSVSSTVATVTVAFNRDHPVGDNFIDAPYWPLASTAAQLSTLFTQFDASIAVGTGGAFTAIEFELYGRDNDGQNTSKLVGVFGDHILHLPT
jgi:hypothetical protein